MHQYIIIPSSDRRFIVFPDAVWRHADEDAESCSVWIRESFQGTSGTTPLNDVMGSIGIHT
jgi:hypothetical protein